MIDSIPAFAIGLITGVCIVVLLVLLARNDRE